MSDNKTPNATDRFDVVITSIFLNDAKPQDWAQAYEWKPSVGFTFKKINKSFEPQEPEMKARANGVANLWLWEAMGGKQAKSRFFDFMVETGVLNGKAWIAIKGVTAELFKAWNDATYPGTARDNHGSCYAIDTSLASGGRKIHSATACTIGDAQDCDNFQW